MGLLDRWTKKIPSAKTAAKATGVVERSLSVKEAASGVSDDKPQQKLVQQQSVVTEGVGTAVIHHHGPAYSIIIRPLVTEKTGRGEASSQYSFVVAASANKTEIKRAIKEMYGIEPIAVNVVNIEGRRVRFGRSMGKRSDYKKAIVRLPKNSFISIHEGV